MSRSPRRQSGRACAICCGPARCQGGTYPDAIHVEETGDILTLTPRGLARRSGEADVRYTFPGAPFAKPEGYDLEELFACDAPTPKEGMHDPRGMVIFYGAGIRQGMEIESVSPLDILPTLLTLLEVPVPGVLNGRVLSEILAVEPTGARAAFGRPEPGWRPGPAGGRRQSPRPTRQT